MSRGLVCDADPSSLPSPDTPSPPTCALSPWKILRRQPHRRRARCHPVASSAAQTPLSLSPPFLPSYLRKESRGDVGECPHAPLTSSATFPWSWSRRWPHSVAVFTRRPRRRGLRFSQPHTYVPHICAKSPPPALAHAQIVTDGKSFDYFVGLSAMVSSLQRCLGPSRPRRRGQET